MALNIGKGCLRIARRREPYPLVAAIQLERPLGISGKQHHAGIVGDRRSESLGQERWYRDPRCVIAPGSEREAYGISDVTVNRIERQHTVGETGNVGAGLNLVRTVRAIVLPVAAKLP